ncbi:MAG: HlyC/CorC family transporter [Myxococcales bacterium]|nr:HlyC/CorC family transporter [Myxococcales bacterium]
MTGLLAALGLVALNGFFVAAEFSFVRVRPAGLERLAKKNVPGAHTAVRIAREIERYLSVSQIGITLASLALGWIGEPAFERVVDNVFRTFTGGRPLGPTSHAIGATLAFATITYLHVLLGEQMPKMLALHKSEEVACFLSRPFRITFLLLSPVRFVIEGATRVLLRGLGLGSKLPSEGELSEEELTGVIAATLAHGPRAEDKRELLERVVRFASQKARNVMVPRVDMAAIAINARPDEALAYLRTHEYSRLVLIERDDIDRPVGYLYAKDLLLDPKALMLPDIASLRRDVLFVPEASSLIDVLRQMQQSNTLFAIVVDEYGGTSGLLTMEDLLEEIVGEIRDEADEDEAPRVREAHNVPGAWDVDPDVLLDELRGLGVDPEDGTGGEPLAAHVVKLLGRIPRKGDRVRLGPFDAEIRAIRRRRVVRLRLYPHAPTMRPAPAVQITQLDYDTDADMSSPNIQGPSGRSESDPGVASTETKERKVP